MRVAYFAEVQREGSGHRHGSGVAGGNAVEDILAVTRLSEGESVIGEVFLLCFFVLQGVITLPVRIVEFSDEFGLGADVSGVTARDRVRGTERLERQVVNLPPVAVTRDLAGNVFRPGEDLLPKCVGGDRFGDSTVDVEAKPKDLGEGVFDSVVELQVVALVTVIPSHDGVAMIRRCGLRTEDVGGERSHRYWRDNVGSFKEGACSCLQVFESAIVTELGERWVSIRAG